MRFTKGKLLEILSDAFEQFNACMDSDITLENTVVEFFTPENGVEVYENLCRKYFPQNLEEDYTADGYFASFAAEAFVGKEVNGILVRSDIDFDEAEVWQVFLHEISHIFCTIHEIENGDFFNRYCLLPGDEGNYYYCGYAIWREAIADIMADTAMSDYAGFRLAERKKEILTLYDNVFLNNPVSKKSMSLVIAYVMLSAEVAGTEDWTVAEKAIQKQLCFREAAMLSILEDVFDNLHEGAFWEITPEFISSLGFKYCGLLAEKAMHRLTAPN